MIALIITTKPEESPMTRKKIDIESDLTQLARIALTARPQDVQALIHRMAKQYRNQKPKVADSLLSLLQESPTRASPLRRQSEMPVPVDGDSRLNLIRIESNPTLDQTPIYDLGVETVLSQLVAERSKPELLRKAGIEPTKSVLFTGPPGVGKTMAARWLAVELKLPLLTLDLAAVMSSYLGRTGTNLRHVLDYAKGFNCVLLLDELDAIAKKRDDGGEIGELKRLVTVLIQEIDDWPSTGLLVAATNHPDLLDPAIWRRFEALVEFPMPDSDAISKFVLSELKEQMDSSDTWASLLGIALAGHSLSDVERDLLAAKRSAIVHGTDLDDGLLSIMKIGDHSKAEKIELATQLVLSGILSQRSAHELTGVARETIRSRVKKQKAQLLIGDDIG